MLCDLCGKEGAYIRKTTKLYGKGEDVLLIENVPIIECPHCHESYMTPQTSRDLDEVNRSRKNTSRRNVEVATLD